MFRGSKTARGATLVEAMLTAFVFLIVLKVVGGLVQSYATVSARMDGGDELTVMVAVLDQVRLEAESALELQSPSEDSTTADQLVFYRIDPLATRFPSPLPPGWQPTASGYQMRVQVSLQEGRLVRSLEGSDGRRQSSTLLRELDSFEVSYEEPGRLEFVCTRTVEDKPLSVRGSSILRLVR